PGLQWTSSKVRWASRLAMKKGTKPTDPSTFLATLTLPDIKAKLQACGLSTVGRKAELIHRLTSHLACDGQRTLTMPAWPAVVSIDIGARNLAFVVITPDHRIAAWETIDLLQTAKVGPLLQKPWLPVVLIRNLVQKILPRPTDLVAAPHQVVYLIERQRFRTVGFTQIPDSVLFINLVESLLYANLAQIGVQLACDAEATIEAQALVSQPSLLDPDALTPPSVSQDNVVTSHALSMNPATISAYFDLKQLVNHTKRAQSKLTLSNKDKKQVVVKLIQAYLNRRASASSPLSLQLINQRQVPWLTCPDDIYQRYLSSSKQDDRSDCLLQALTWYSWKINRTTLARDLRAQMSQ
ncbi:hypothetical protein H4R34_002911, partial [Dimargaris verticillata]